VRYILDSLVQTNEKNNSMRHHKSVNMNITDIAASFTLIEEYYVVLERVNTFSLMHRGYGIKKCFLLPSNIHSTGLQNRYKLI
jgi:hypothetical protein